MADNKKYYYLKLKENFFDSEEMILLESMENGKDYALILLKMYLRSLKGDGRLMYRNLIPYTPETLAKVLRHDTDIVKNAIESFEKLGLIEVLDGGAIFMTDIQNFIGESSTEADRKRAYRERIKQEREAAAVGENE
jgi:predicted phage replisome organizer